MRTWTPYHQWVDQEQGRAQTGTKPRREKYSAKTEVERRKCIERDGYDGTLALVQRPLA